MNIHKLKIADINTESLKEEADKELFNLHRHLHGIWSIKRKEPNKLDVSLEDIWNAHKLVVEEIIRRGFKHISPLGRNKIITKDDDDLAKVNPSGNVLGEVIKLEEVLKHIKSFKVRQPLIYLVGGIVNNGETKGDIDFQVKGKLPPGMLKIIQFRLGRMLPKEMSSRISVLSDDYDGPFTNNIPLGDLLFKRNDDFTILRMNEDIILEEDDFELEENVDDLIYIDDINIENEIIKQDLLQQYPKEAGKQKAVIQLHFRGKSVHADYRIQLGKELVGWTLFIQKPGKVSDIKNIAEGKKIISGYDLATGNNYLKPILAPAGLQAVTKKPEPIDWIDVEGVVEPGQVGATAYEEGIFVIAETPNKFKTEFGIQKPHFHEYFLTNGNYLNGILYFRLLSSRGYERTGGGPTFWRAFISKNHLPSILNARSVKEGTMPPDGVSAIPLSLMNQTPEEFKYWKAKGSKAKEIRDALVKEKVFTEENIKIVNNEFKKVESQKKALLIRNIEKKEIDFLFQYQLWKGQFVTRIGPSKEQWIFYLDTDSNSNKIPAFVMELDPTQNEKVTAIKESRDRKFLELEGEIKAGEFGNPTKNTPSWVNKIESGKVTIYEDSPGFIKFDSKLKHIKGIWTLSQEELGSDIWKVEYQKEKVPQTKSDVLSDEDIFPSFKADFKPLIYFTPLKGRSGFDKGEFFNIDNLINNWAKPILKAKGKLIVNPKWNGFRTIIEKKGEGDNADVYIFFEDKKEDKSFAMPGIVEEAKKIKGDYILDTELLEYDKDKNDFINRKELAKWAATKEKLDDSKVIFKVFGILYWDKSYLREFYKDIASEVDSKIKGLKHFDNTEHYLISNEADLKEAVKKVSKLPGSEGAMVKLANSTYTLGGRTDSWVKYKIPRMINAIILDKHKVKDTEKTYNFSGGIGPIPKSEEDKYADVIDFKNNKFVRIGQTFNTNLKSEIGDIVTVTASEIFVEEKAGKEHITWFIPIVTGINEVSKPDSIDHVRKLGLGEISKRDFEYFTPIYKVDKVERMVYGIVLEPNTVDAQGDIVSPEEIKKTAHKFMEDYQKLGYQHEEFDKKLKIMESYLSPQELVIEGQTIKQGTWLLATRVLDNEVWKEVLEGKITGYSIGGAGIRVRRDT